MRSIISFQLAMDARVAGQIQAWPYIALVDVPSITGLVLLCFVV